LSERRGARTLRKCAQLELETLVELSLAKHKGGVYIRVNTDTHRWRYIGQTMNYATRDEQHLRNEHKAQQDNKSIKDEQYATYYAFASKHGGAGHWVWMPVTVLPSSAPKADRLRLERWFIRQYGSLNTVGGVWNRPKTKKRSRKRPVKRLRGKNEARRGPVTEMAPTLYVNTATGATYTDFCRALENSQAGTTWQVRNGTFNVSRDKSVQRTFGHSKLRVEYVDGLVLGGRAKDMIWRPETCKKHGLERVLTITVTDVQNRKRTAHGEGIAETLEQLWKSTGPRVRRVLRGTHYPVVRRLWTAAGEIKHELRRRNARINLNNHARDVWGISMSARTTIRVETTERSVMQAAVRAAEGLLHCVTGPLALKRDMAKRLKAVRVRPNNISRLMCNWRKENQEFDHTVDPESLCV
jgi:hypothetical protein